MPFRQRLKSIVKGEAPLFEHLRHRRATTPQHADYRHLDAEPSRDPNLFQPDYNLGARPREEKATEAAVVGPGSEHVRKQGDIVRARDEIGSPMGERREGHILKDTLRDRGADERREGALAERKGRSDIGGGGYDVDRRTKAPPPPPPTTATVIPQRSVDRAATAAAHHALSLGSGEDYYYREGRPKPTRDLRYDLPVHYGPQQQRLAATQGGVIQDKQAICESMATTAESKMRDGRSKSSPERINGGDMRENTAPSTVTGGRNRTYSAPPRDYHIPSISESPEKKYREGEDQGRVATSAVHYTTKNREYTSLPTIITSAFTSYPTTTTSSSRPESTHYSTLHNILPATYRVSPDEGLFHHSANLGGRSSSVLSNRSDARNLRDWGIDPTAGIYEITNFGEGKRAPVMGVEEEGEWYRDDPVRGGCYYKVEGGGMVRFKEG